MSIKIMTRVWEHSQANGVDLLLLLALADNADDSGYCWPGIEYLAHKVRMTPRSVINITRRLEESGELLVVRSRRGGNRYVILTGMDDAERQASAEKLICERRSHEPRSHQKCTPFTSDVNGVHIRSETAVSHEPSITINETVKEPSLGDSAVAASAPEASGTSNALRKLLEDRFCELTGIQHPPTKTKAQSRAAGALWFAPLREIAVLAGNDEYNALSLLEASVRHLLGAVTISNPKSVIKTANAIAAGTAAGVNWKPRNPGISTRQIVNSVTGVIETVEV